MSEFRDLGVFIDSKLSFTKHISTITAKEMAACIGIRQEILLLVTFEHWNHCTSHWFSHTWGLPFYGVHKNKIESVQKQFTIFALLVNNNFKITPYKQRLVKLNMSSLNRRRIDASNAFLFDILNSNTNCPSIRRILETNMGNRRLRSNECMKITDKKMKLALSALIPEIC